MTTPSPKPVDASESRLRALVGQLARAELIIEQLTAERIKLRTETAELKQQHATQQQLINELCNASADGGGGTDIGGRQERSLAAQRAQVEDKQQAHLAALKQLRRDNHALREQRNLLDGQNTQLLIELDKVRTELQQDNARLRSELAQSEQTVARQRRDYDALVDALHSHLGLLPPPRDAGASSSSTSASAPVATATETKVGRSTTVQRFVTRTASVWAALCEGGEWRGQYSEALNGRLDALLQQYRASMQT